MASIKLERKFWDVLGCSMFFFVCRDVKVFGDGTLFATQRDKWSRFKKTKH